MNLHNQIHQDGKFLLLYYGFWILIYVCCLRGKKILFTKQINHSAKSKLLILIKSQITHTKNELKKNKRKMQTIYKRTSQNGEKNERKRKKEENKIKCLSILFDKQTNKQKKTK